ncbi:MAG: sigma-70 family RNA polymerase sigma factor [Oscillospiraceae bacterium]|nr:sigma-70 family RNA polymerase sigma factor [Oscillospiraceae bacterium]
MEDKDIVDLYWQRSDRAISETERKYGRYCRKIAANICGNEEDAEECVNDTWLRAWGSMPDRRPATLSGFLGRITRNFALDRIKAKKRNKRGGGEAPLALDELAECVSGGTEPERALDEKLLRESVGRFVAALPEPEKTVFVLRYWYLAPIREIGAKLQLDPGKVKKLLARTRQKLRDRLQEEGSWWIR